MCPNRNGGGSQVNPDKPPPLRYITDIITISDKRKYKDPILLHQKYIVERLSAKQIAKEFGCSKAAILDNLKRFEISLRDKGKHHGRSGTPKFGAKLFQGRAVEHKAERKVIDTIVGLRKQGMQLIQIAAFLSQVGVPTKTKGVRWNRKIIRVILDRENIT